MAGLRTRTVVRWLLIPAGALAAAYLLLALYGCAGADRLIFQPPPASYPAGGDILRIAAADGLPLAARWYPRAGAQCTVLFFHGNAEDLGDVDPLMRALRDRLDVSVLAWDYRGYGRTDGKPGETNALRDARAVFAYATGPLGVPRNRVILFGRSLGGGPAIDLAADGGCGGLVIQSAFTSAFRVMTRVRVLPFDRFANIEKMPRVTCPVLVIHGTADEVIPFRHGEQLLAAAGGRKRRLWVYGAGHNDLVEVAGESYWSALREFVSTVEAPVH